jgi:peroxiredoxin
MPEPHRTILLLSCISILAAAGCSQEQPDYGKAPEFTLPDINGGTVSLSDFKGKVVIIQFWTTWCPGCIKEIPGLIDLYDRYREQGLEVIGIALDQEGARVVSPFVEKNNVDYTILLGNRAVSDSYKTKGLIPTAFVVDRTGQIRRKYVGYRKKSVFEKIVNTLLTESTQPGPPSPNDQEAQ